MVRIMTTDDETTEETSEEAINKATIQGWVRETLEEILQEIPGEGSVETAEESEMAAGLTVRQIEDAARRAVEESMAPLLEAAGKTKKAPVKKVAKKAPEPSPASVTKSKLYRALFGEDD